MGQTCRYDRRSEKQITVTGRLLTSGKIGSRRARQSSKACIHIVNEVTDFTGGLDHIGNAPVGQHILL